MRSRVVQRAFKQQGIATVVALLLALLAGGAVVLAALRGGDERPPASGVAAAPSAGRSAGEGGPTCRKLLDAHLPPASDERFGIAVVRVGKRVRVLDSPRGELLGRADRRTRFGSATAFSIAERAGCWLGAVTEIAGNRKLGWIRFDPRRLRLSWTAYSLHADLSERRLELRRTGRVLERIIVTIGSPETPTPTGRFAITDKLAGHGLNPVYGCCALGLTAVQPSLPADWPGGEQLAIHGWDGIVGEAASNGCLRATDHDMRLLMRRVPLATPVFIEQ